MYMHVTYIFSFFIFQVSNIFEDIIKPRICSLGFDNVDSLLGKLIVFKPGNENSW
jgi:hypothetical protein